MEKLGGQTKSALQQKLAEKPSLEVRRQIEQILSQMEQLSPEALQALRAVEVLEHIGSPAARQVLKELAASADGCRLTLDAKGALQRLSKRSAPEQNK